MWLSLEQIEVLHAFACIPFGSLLCMTVSSCGDACNKIGTYLKARALGHMLFPVLSSHLFCKQYTDAKKEVPQSTDHSRLWQLGTTIYRRQLSDWSACTDRTGHGKIAR